MIKRYHEAPISIFKQVQEITDGDYALVHLFESDPEYLEQFEDAVRRGRDVILDNSIFELGKAFNGDKFALWVNHLKPTWYIVPDSWKNGEKTTEMFFDFITKHPNLEGKRIGVAQGYTPLEVAKCYKAIEPHCDMVAFNLDFSSVFYESLPKSLTEEMRQHMIPYCVAMSLGRYRVIQELYDRGVINTRKPHHLLGCGVPQEVTLYDRDWTWIRSIDTSNPVSAGMEYRSYEPLWGVREKSTMLMCEQMHYDVSLEQWSHIQHNIKTMKEWCE